MTFPVKDPKDFSSLQVGHCIDATVLVQGDNFWIGDVKHWTHRRRIVWRSRVHLRRQPSPEPNGLASAR